MVQQSINYILTGDDKGEIPDELLTANIAVSFDTGWQK